MSVVSNKPLILFGGTFNPVHFGHLRAAIELAEAFDVPEVSLMPCYQAVHRDLSTLGVDHRLAMLQLAVAEYSRLTIEDREIHRKGPSFSIDTLMAFRDEVGPDRPIYFAMGADAFNDIEQWKHWQKLLDFSNLVIMRRPGVQIDWRLPLFRDNLCHFEGKHLAAGCVFQLPVCALAISSTKIRECIMSHQSIDFLLPPSVRDYIERHQLYVNHL